MMSHLIPFENHLMLDEFFRNISSPGFFIKPLHGDPLPAQIKIEVKEDKKNYTICAELPGLNKSDIHAMVENKMVTINAEIKQEDKQTEGEKVLRGERYYGSVSRSVQLPGEVDMSQALAKYENGILRLTLPKKASSSSKPLMIT